MIEFGCKIHPYIHITIENEQSLYFIDFGQSETS